MSIQKFLSNHNNAIVASNITASGVAPSNLITLKNYQRSGNGKAQVTGEYTGAEDATFDILITDTTTSNRVSIPVFSGQGSGTLANVQAGSATAQNIAITLVDTGIATESAKATVDNIIVSAKASGALGNGIKIEITKNLTKTTTNKTLLADIPENTTSLKGQENDFFAKILNAKGELDTASKRFSIGDDNTVYRQYKKYINSVWEYCLLPTTTKKYLKGSQIYEITGDYTVTISQNNTIETYTGIITMYDFFAALLTSSLVNVSGSITKNMIPNGMGTLDCNIRTYSYFQEMSKTREQMPKIENISIGQTAPTEIITATCIENEITGEELWKISGNVSGVLSSAYQTGQQFISKDVISLQIPKWISEYNNDDTTKAGIKISNIELIKRGSSVDIPEICMGVNRLGIAAAAATYTATYTEYTTATDCYCATAPVVGSINTAALGLAPEREEAMDASYKQRLDSLYSKRKDFIDHNTKMVMDGYTYRIAITVSPFIDSNVAYITKDTEAFTTQAMAQAYSTPAVMDVPTQDIQTGLWYTSATAMLTGNDSQTPLYFTSAANRDAFISRMLVQCPSATWQQTGEGYYFGTASSIYYAADNPAIKFMEECFALMLAPLPFIYTVSTALTMYDAIVEEMWLMLSPLTFRDPVSLDTIVQNVDFLKRYKSAFDMVYLEAGLVPGKDSPSSSSVGVWSDLKQDFWSIPGYAPIYTNNVYHSTKFDSQNEPYQTKEFALTIACACPERLVYGDKITLTIEGGSPQPKTFGIGDAYEITTISAEPIQLTGGVTGDNTHTWKVKGDSTTFDNFLVINNTPTYYTDTGTGFSFGMAYGAIPFAIGDKFTCAIEGGKFKWRKDNNAWSSEIDIIDTTLSDGLSVSFVSGAYPSFVSGDNYLFSAVQKHAVTNVLTPNLESSWKFNAAAECTINVPNTFLYFAIVHNFPEGTQITCTPILSTPITCGKTGIEVIELDAMNLPTTVTMAFPAAGEIYYIYFGIPATTMYAPTEISLKRSWGMLGNAKMNYGQKYIYQGHSGSVTWRDGAITKSELDDHIAMIDYVKQHDDQPVLFIPHTKNKKEAFLCRIDTNQIDIEDVLQFHPNNPEQRILSLSIPLAPVFA